jgi:hypothetical protein
VDPTDDVVVVNKTVGSATTVTLPAAPTTGEMLVVKDGKGDAGTNPITVGGNGKTLDGAASYTIDVNSGSVTLVYNGTEWDILSTVSVSSASLSRFTLMGDLAAAVGTTTGGPIIDYVFVESGFTISAINMLCPVSPSSGNITIDILRATSSGGAFSSLYATNTKPSLTCAGNASYQTFTGSNLPDIKTIAAGSVLAVRLTNAPLGASDLYVTIR